MAFAPASTSLSVSALSRAIRRSERDRAAGDEAVGGDDLVEDLLWRPRVGRHHHHRERVVRGRFVVVAADGGRGDVDAVRAERLADAADHAGDVGVAEDREVLLDLDVEALAPGLEQVRAVASPEG